MGLAPQAMDWRPMGQFPLRHSFGGLAQGPKGPMAPCWGGRIHSREARRGVGTYLGVPWCIPPQMAPISGVLVGTSQESWENSILDIRVLLHGYFLHEYMFFFSEYRNKVINLQAIDPQNISKFPSETDRNEP